LNCKQIFLSVFTITIGLALTAYTAYGANPQVTNVQASQRTDGSMLVDISYDVSDEDGDSVTISASVSADDGLSYDVNATSFIGDTGAEITPGTGKTIVWDAGTDVPGVYGTEYRVKVIADDGKGDESTAGYKAGVVLSKALKYCAFSSKKSAFKSSSATGNIPGQSMIVKIVDKVVKILDRVFQTKPKQNLNAAYPNPSPYPSPYATGFPSYTPYGTGYPSYTPYGTVYPGFTPYGTVYPGFTPYGTGYPNYTPYPTGGSSGGIEGFTYNGDGTFVGTWPEYGTTGKLSFYKADGSQITVDITDPSNYQVGGELYGEDNTSFLFQAELTTDVTKNSVTVHMEMISGLTTGVGDECPEIKMTGSGTFEFADIGTGESTSLTATITDCENVSGTADIKITIDGEECITSRDFDENGFQGGTITCNGVQLGEITREDDGNLYYWEPDKATGTKTLIDESLF